MSAVSGRFVRGRARRRSLRGGGERGAGQSAPSRGSFPGLPAAAAVPPPDRGARELPSLFGRVSAAAAPWCILVGAGGRSAPSSWFSSKEKQDPDPKSVAVLPELLLSEPPATCCLSARLVSLGRRGGNGVTRVRLWFFCSGGFA